MMFGEIVTLYCGFSLIIGFFTTLCLGWDDTFDKLNTFGWIMYILTGLCGILMIGLIGLSIVILSSILKVFIKKEYR